MDINTQEHVILMQTNMEYRKIYSEMLKLENKKLSEPEKTILEDLKKFLKEEQNNIILK